MLEEIQKELILQGTLKKKQASWFLTVVLIVHSEFFYGPRLKVTFKVCFEEDEQWFVAL